MQFGGCRTGSPPAMQAAVPDLAQEDAIGTAGERDAQLPQALCGSHWCTDPNHF